MTDLALRSRGMENSTHIPPWGKNSADRVLAVFVKFQCCEIYTSSLKLVILAGSVLDP